MVQEEPAATLPPQVFVWLKGAVVVRLVICSGPVPVLFNVTFSLLLVVPTNCDPNMSVVGVTEAAGVVPRPIRVMNCVVPAL